MQEKGQVTIPSDIRKKLRLRKGDLVTFVEKENGVVIQPVEAAAQELFDSLEKSLNMRGHTLEAVLGAYQRIGGEGAGRQFGLSDDEKSTLYMVLQLQAQQALEAIRNQAELPRQYQLSDDEIEAEIQDARNEASRSPGS
jgi:AbrB family looped-hinge helix DNA binding protein